MADRNEVARQALTLPPEDRAYVAELLDRSLSQDAFATPEIAEAWSQEIDRRIEAFDRGETQAVDAETVLGRLRQALDDHRGDRSS